MGTILGTLQYVSPEQIEGKDTDARSDIFAFGLVLYEMITGKRPFEGASQASLIASILKDQPRPISDLQPITPKALDRVVQTCLEKDPDKRWQSAREVKHALEWLVLDAPPSVLAPSASTPSGRALRVWQACAAALALVTVGSVTWAFRPVPAPAAAVTRFQIPLPENATYGQYMSLSPDGCKLAFTIEAGDAGLWIRNMDGLKSRPVPGSQNASAPFWSPDSRFIAFGIGNQLKKVEATGGPPQTLCEVPTPVGSGAWNKDGAIIFGGRGGGPINRVAAAGGVATPVTALDRTRREAFHTLPSFLPDGRHFVYFRNGPIETSGVFVGSLDAKPDEQSHDRVLASTFGALYAAEFTGGKVFFLRKGTLMAQPFDEKRVALTGEPVPVAERVGNGGSQNAQEPLTVVLNWEAGVKR